MLRDLEQMNVLESPVILSQIQSKIASLQNAHQCAFTTEAKMGAGSSGFQYMDVMNDLFGPPMPIITMPSSSVRNSIVVPELSTTEAKMGAGSPGFQYMDVMNDLFGPPMPIITMPSSSVRNSVVVPELCTSTPSSSTSSDTLCLSSVSSSHSSAASSHSSAASSHSSAASSHSSATSSNSSVDVYDAYWTDGQVRALLDCYANREEELKHPTKKKFFYNNVLQDLMSLGVLNRSVTANTLQNKMRALLTAYKAARDTETQTGRAATKFKYMREMEEIFGRRPIISNTHTSNLYGKEISALTLRSQSEIPDDIDEIVPVFDKEEDVVGGIFSFHYFQQTFLLLFNLNFNKNSIPIPFTFINFNFFYISCFHKFRSNGCRKRCDFRCTHRRSN